jgi:hypothetical protein
MRMIKSTSRQVIAVELQLQKADYTTRAAAKTPPVSLYVSITGIITTYLVLRLVVRRGFLDIYFQAL